jgi:hypothetical protein
MNKLTELEALKYWIDSEFSILHAMFGIIMLNLVEAWFWKAFFVVYIIFSIIYAIVRIAYVAQYNKDFLKVPKK